MKLQRQRTIMKILAQKPIETQEELALELRRRGIKVTQATVSRDIKELRLVKVAAGDNRYRYDVPRERITTADQTKVRRIFRDSVISLDLSENIIVVKTTPGAAQAVALVIDNERCPEIIGTVAGDDTVLVIVKPKTAGPQVLRKLNTYLL